MEPHPIDLYYYAPIVEGKVSLSFTEYINLPLREMAALQSVFTWHRELQRNANGNQPNGLGEEPQYVDGLEVYQFEAGKAKWAWHEVSGPYRETLEQKGKITTIGEQELAAHDERIAKLREREWQFISALDDAKVRQCGYEFGLQNAATKSRDALLSEIHGMLVEKGLKS